MNAWIVGNGLSLNQTPPEKIRNGVSFATNLIAKRFASHPWRPTFFVAVSDAPHKPEYLPYFLAGMHGATHGTFVSEENESVFSEEHNEIDTLIKTYDDQPGWIKFDNEGHRNFNRWGMSHMVSFQIAAEMVVRKVYMIGFDGNFGPHELGEDHNHFDNSYWGKFQVERPKDPEFWERMNRDHAIAHSVIKAEYEKLGIELYNCTPNSAFTMHEYMPFEDAINA